MHSNLPRIFPYVPFHIIWGRNNQASLYFKSETNDLRVNQQRSKTIRLVMNLLQDHLSILGTIPMYVLATLNLIYSKICKSIIISFNLKNRLKCHSCTKVNYLSQSGISRLSTKKLRRKWTLYVEKCTKYDTSMFFQAIS